METQADDKVLSLPSDIERPSKRWGAEQSLEFYNIDGWGAGYFNINELGQLTMQPKGNEGLQIPIVEIVENLKKSNIHLPCIIRFQDILRDRVEKLNRAFLSAMKEFNYTGTYRGVYPIKVNQMREVIEEILDAGEPFHYGLEAGSKAELQIVLAYNVNPQALTICNGFKDEDYIRLAMIARKLERKTIIVVEQFSELELTLRIAKEMNVEPILGVRGKLATRSTGKWQDSGGHSAKFGLTMSEILNVVQVLKEKDCLHYLKLFHFHIGSQIPDIRTFKEVAQEGARVYTSLKKLGVPIEYLDIGGGLGVDYDGSKSKSDYSINYTFEEYIADIVHQIQAICDQEKVDHPNIVSESGRFITAHHSCLVMNVLDAIDPKTSLRVPKPQPGKALDLVEEMEDLVKNISPKNALEAYHDAGSMRDQILTRFKLGLASLEERAYIEDLYRQACHWMMRNRSRIRRISDELDEFVDKQAAHYLANFSVFQSAPDHWAFDQLFPIVPLHRMLERPRHNAILMDITCDSDGAIDRYINREEAYTNSIKLHKHSGKNYYLGMFLTGAYQDIMGDLHNLYGRVNEVHVFSDEDEKPGYYIETVIKGDTISSVIETQQFSVPHLKRSIRVLINDKVKEGKIKPREGIKLIDFYEEVLSGYTYLQAQPASRSTNKGSV